MNKTLISIIVLITIALVCGACTGVEDKNKLIEREVRQVQWKSATFNQETGKTVYRSSDRPEEISYDNIKWIIN